MMQILKVLPKDYLIETDPESLHLNEGEMVMFRGIIKQANMNKASPMKRIFWVLHVENPSQESYMVHTNQVWGTTSKGAFAAQAVLKAHPVGSDSVFIGKLEDYNDIDRTIYMALNRILPGSELDTCCTMPIYQDKKKIKSKDFNAIIGTAIKALEPLETLNLYPETIMQKYKIGSWLKALFTLHRPPSMDSVDQSSHILMFHV